MGWSLHDARGRRKYLVHAERRQVLNAASRAGGRVGTLCAVLVICGTRLSEALAITPEMIDDGNLSISVETLKRRQRGFIRSVPVPRDLLDWLDAVHQYRLSQREPDAARRRLWLSCRTTAWKQVKRLMLDAGVPAHLATPRALRHTFGVEATACRISLSVVQKWLGHAKIETTAIYATPIGKQERALARLTWRGTSFGRGSEREAAGE